MRKTVLLALCGLLVACPRPLSPTGGGDGGVTYPAMEVTAVRVHNVGVALQGLDAGVPLAVDGGLDLAVHAGAVLHVHGRNFPVDQVEVLLGNARLALDAQLASTPTDLYVRLPPDAPSGLLAVRAPLWGQTTRTNLTVRVLGPGYLAGARSQGLLRQQLAITAAGVPPAKGAWTQATGADSYAPVSVGGGDADGGGPEETAQAETATNVLAVAFNLGLVPDPAAPAYVTLLGSKSGTHVRSLQPWLDRDGGVVPSKVGSLRPYTAGEPGTGEVAVAGIQYLEGPDGGAARRRLVAHAWESDPDPFLHGPIFRHAPAAVDGGSKGGGYWLVFRTPPEGGLEVRALPEQDEPRREEGRLFFHDGDPVAVGEVPAGLLPPSWLTRAQGPRLVVVSCLPDEAGTGLPPLQLSIYTPPATYTPPTWDGGWRPTRQSDRTVPWPQDESLGETCSKFLCGRGDSPWKSRPALAELTAWGEGTFVITAPEGEDGDLALQSCLLLARSSTDSTTGSPTQVGEGSGGPPLPCDNDNRCDCLLEDGGAGPPCSGDSAGPCGDAGVCLASAMVEVGALSPVPVGTVSPQFLGLGQPTGMWGGSREILRSPMVEMAAMGWVESVATDAYYVGLWAEPGAPAAWAVRETGEMVDVLTPDGIRAGSVSALGAPLLAWPLPHPGQVGMVRPGFVLLTDITGQPIWSHPVPTMRGGRVALERGAQGQGVAAWWSTAEIQDPRSTTPQVHRLFRLDPAQGFPAPEPVEVWTSPPVSKDSQAVLPLMVTGSHVVVTHVGQGAVAQEACGDRRPATWLARLPWDGVQVPGDTLPEPVARTCDTGVVAFEEQAQRVVVLGKEREGMVARVVDLAGPAPVTWTLRGIPMSAVVLPSGAILGIVKGAAVKFGCYPAAPPPPGESARWLELGPAPFMRAVMALSPDGTRLFAGVEEAVVELLLPPMWEDGCPLPDMPPHVISRTPVEGTPSALEFDEGGGRLVWVDAEGHKVGVVE
jgi:hypothetical protein